jgi:hypothetical protein
MITTVHKCIIFDITKQHKMKKLDLNSSEYNEYYSRYIDKLQDETNLIEGYAFGKTSMINFINSIPNDKLLYRYQPEKWSIKEVIQHLIDTERIFMYRCFRIARNDKTDIEGFEQDDYVKPSEADSKSKAELIEEFSINRENSIMLLKSISDKNLCFIGTTNGVVMSSRAAAFTILGHDIHHTEIIKERYL